MKKRIFSLLLAIVMLVTFAPSVFAATLEDSYKVGASISAAKDGDALRKSVAVIESAAVLNTKNVGFEVILSTEEIKGAIKAYYDYGVGLIGQLFDPTDYPVENNELMTDFNNSGVNGTFTITVDVSKYNDIVIPPEYLTTSEMYGFNAESKIVFEEVSRNYESGTLTINLKIKDGMKALELYKIANGEGQGLGSLIFTATGISAARMDIGTCYVDGKLEGKTSFQFNSHVYDVDFYTNTVRSYITAYKGHGVEGEVKVNGFEEGNVLKVTFVNYVTGEEVEANHIEVINTTNGFTEFKFTLDEGSRVKSGTYNIVIEVIESNAPGAKTLATVTKIVTVTDIDDDVVADKSHLNLHRTQNSADKTVSNYHPHDKFEIVDDPNKDDAIKTTDGNVVVAAPVAGESDSKSDENHEADVAIDEIIAENESGVYDEAKEALVKDLVGEENVDNAAVEEEFHSDRWIEGAYHENYVGKSETGLTDNQKQVKSSQEKIQDEIDSSDNIKNPVKDKEDDVEVPYVEPTTVFFEFNAFASDRIDYTIQLTDENGNNVGGAKTKTVYIDENHAFKDVEQKRRVFETETIYEIVVNIDELAETEKEFYELYASGKNVFVHREHEGDVEQFKLLSEGHYKNGKHVDATYYVDDEYNQIHIFTRKFSEYAITLADGTPEMYTTGSATVKDPYVIKFNIDGVVGEVADITTSAITILSTGLPKPTKEGYTFDGWYLDASLTKKASGMIKVTDGMVLYGHWKNVLIDTENHFAYIIGYEDGTIRAENNITRAEVVTIFYRLLRDDIRAKYFTTENNFSDVNAGDWFNTYISTMANGGFIMGYPNGTFAPNAYITRAEFATMATRFAVLNGTDGKTFTDIEDHWAEVYVLKASTAGWINGYPDGTFLPENKITRAEAVAIINRVLGRSVDKAGIHKDATVWSDLKDAWYYCDMIEATNSHDFTRNADGKTETWTAITANKTWN